MFSRKLVLLGVCCLFITPFILAEDRADPEKALPPGAWWEPPGYRGATAHGPALQPGRSAWPRSYQPASQRDDYWDRVAASRRAQPALRSRLVPTKEQEPLMELPVSDVLGVPYEEVRGQKMSPQLVIDTISFFDGLAICALNTQRGRGRSSLVASSEDDIHILSIYNVDVDSTTISRTLDTIKVYSASASDDSRANIMLMVQ